MVAIVYTSKAKMPGSCWGYYREVYAVDVPYDLAWKASRDHGDKYERYRDVNRGKKWRPTTINQREVLRVLRYFGHQHVGLTTRCAYWNTIERAQTFCDQWNARRDQAEGDLLISTGSA